MSMIVMVVMSGDDKRDSAGNLALLMWRAL